MALGKSIQRLENLFAPGSLWESHRELVKDFEVKRLLTNRLILDPQLGLSKNESWVARLT